MTRHLLFGVLVLGVALLCWDLGKRGARAYERMLVQQVKNGLDVLGYRWVQIHADGLKLELHGHAPDVLAQELALESARATAPVAEIVDFSTATLAPPERREPVRIELHRDARGVTLIGQTASRQMRARLNRALSRDGPDLQVEDLTGIQAAQPPRNWGPEINVASLAAAGLPNAFVVVEPGQVTVDAQTVDEAEREEITRRLLDAAEGTVSVVLRLKTPSFVIAPFSFSIEKSMGGGIRLENCAARSSEEQAVLRSRLEALSKEMRSDACTVGLGGPEGDWAGAILSGLDSLERLPAGRLEISYRAAKLIGLPPTTSDEFETIGATFVESLPPGFSGDTELRTDDLETLRGISQGSYWMHIAVDADGVHIDGQVSDATGEQVVSTYAAAQFGAGKVTAAVSVGDGPAPENWQKAQLKVIEILTRMAGGKAELAGNRISLEADMPGPEAARDLHLELLDGLPDFVVSTRLTVDLGAQYRAIELPAARCADELSRRIQKTPIVFDTGSAVLAKESEQIMDDLARLLERCNGDRIEIGGHTDSQGPVNVNLRISKARAEAVRSALIKRGIRLDTLVARGYGEGDPLADNKTETGRARNRRIEFKPAT